MSFTQTISVSETFTITHARRLGSKVATDLKRIQRFHTAPSDRSIEAFEAELIAYLHADYLDTVTYGFQRDGRWIEPTLQYTASELLNGSAQDQDPGGIRPRNTSSANFGSYMTHSQSWWALSDSERQAFEQGLPIQRTAASEPGVTGYFEADRSYVAGSRALTRGRVRSFS